MSRNRHLENEDAGPKNIFSKICEVLMSVFLILVLVSIGIIAIAVATTILVKGTEAAWVAIQEFIDIHFG